MTVPVPHDGAPRRADEASPLQQIRDALGSLSGATRRVAETILGSPAEAGRSSITVLAARAEASAATVTRLAALLGYSGYPALRAAIATEYGRGVQGGWDRDLGSVIQPADPPEQVLTVLATAQSRALRNAMGSIDLAVAARVADRIAAAPRIHVFGEWGDAIPARELTIRLLRIGRPVWFFEGQRESHVGTSLLHRGDVALAVDRSGDDAVARAFLTDAGERGAFTALITGMPDSPTAAEADAVLFTGTRETSTWTDYFAGRSSDTLVASLLWVLVAQRTPEALAEAFVSLHGPAPEPER
ncbi:RpiR family transcriptional regulator [Pseudonocardia hierapolitana]|uniref:RpiR family transcriptional regulator n=1 Tax=Pseudonocardia hierapolitana TaxID=1128676 RepID=A0A561SUJ7_9PSEU|nr:MurR/RpiR family transcriptional regulator [Pseudonocardia hierapolitana]TWF78524.1 RpiR family transcriptional regulator [Pseudonocardia hierapolitana]